MWAEQRHPGLLAERQNIESMQNAKAWDKVLAPLMAVSIGFPMVIVAGWTTAITGHTNFRYG